MQIDAALGTIEKRLSWELVKAADHTNVPFSLLRISACHPNYFVIFHTVPNHHCHPPAWCHRDCPARLGTNPRVSKYTLISDANSSSDLRRRR